MKTVFYNAKVYTGKLPFGEAFSVCRGKFADVGTNEEILKTAEPGDELVDLGGRFVCAGFNDSHMHLLNFGQCLLAAPLYRHTGSLEDMLGCLREQLDRFDRSGGLWLTGRGWNQDYFTDVHRMPNRFDLDGVSRDIPIMISRACGHCCAVNSKALELIGITADTQPPEGGDIGFDNGEPNGLFFDNAMELVLSKMPLPGIEELKRMILLACRELNSYGVTSAQTDDYCVFRDIPPETVNRAYEELRQSGELTVRVYEQCNFTELEKLKTFIENGNTTGKGDELFRIGPLKMLGDGALGSRTAHLSLPYLDAPENSGFSLFAPEHMKKMVEYANDHGMQTAIHAIGDACLDEVLDAIGSALKKTPRQDHRHGVVHCQISRRDQLERIAALHMHVYCQSIFLDYDNHIVEKLVDPSLTKTSYSWKTLSELGASVSNGSDCPVELPDVMKGIGCAVTRRSADGTGPYLPGEAFTVRQAIDSFTKGGAYASFEESIKGMIEPGMLADFTVLEADPFTTLPERIKDIRVAETYIGGKRVFKRK